MKERLTGAIILVALLVLLVPELLTGPGSFKMAAKPAGAEGAPLRSYTIDLQDDAASRRPPAVAASADPVAQATPEPDAEPPPAPNVTPPVDDAARATRRPMGSGADPLAAAPDAPATAVAKPGTTTPPPGADDDKPRSAFGPNAVTRAPPEKPASAGKSDAAKSPDAAKAEGARVAAAKAEALKAEAAKADAAKADAARAEAAKADAAKARAVKADAAHIAAAKPEAAKSAGSNAWAVQLGVFGSRENAERLAKQVKGSGFPVLINETSGKDGKKLYWVRVGPEAEQSAADALSARLKAAGHRDARVVSYP